MLLLKMEIVKMKTVIEKIKTLTTLAPATVGDVGGVADQHKSLTIEPSGDVRDRKFGYFGTTYNMGIISSMLVGIFLLVGGVTHSEDANAQSFNNMEELCQIKSVRRVGVWSIRVVFICLSDNSRGVETYRDYSFWVERNGEVTPWSWFRFTGQNEYAMKRCTKINYEGRGFGRPFRFHFTCISPSTKKEVKSLGILTGTMSSIGTIFSDAFHFERN